MTDPVALELDCRGQRCPRPVIELAKAVLGSVPGQLVAVITTDPAAGTDIPAWCRMRNQEYLGSEPLPDGAIQHLVRACG